MKRFYTYEDAPPTALPRYRILVRYHEGWRLRDMAWEKIPRETTAGWESPETTDLRARSQKGTNDVVPSL